MSEQKADSTAVTMEPAAITAPQIDIITRDPNNINDHLGVAFEDIFAEPDGAQSINCVWKCSNMCFNIWGGLCYCIVTTLSSICLASYWACCFACTAYSQIWIVTPCFKLCDININCLKKFYGTCIHCFCDPWCEACGLIFTAFKPAARNFMEI